MQKYHLDKVLDVGVTYQAESDKAYIIKKVGTNSAGEAKLNVAGGFCLSILQELARLNPDNSYWYDLLDLNDFYVVVPPDKKFYFTGDAGSKLRIVGDILEFMYPEALGGAEKARFDEQAKRYYGFLRGQFSKGTDTAWPVNEENPVLTKTAEAGIRYYLVGPMFAKIENLSALHNPGDWTLRFYMQEKPWDILNTGMGDLGIDLWKFHWNDGTDQYYQVQTPQDIPPQIEPGRTLKVTAINSSGASKSPASGASITVTFTIGCIIELL